MRVNKKESLFHVDLGQTLDFYVEKEQNIKLAQNFQKFL